MKILTSSQMAKVDKATFEDLGVSSLAVMESAGRAVAQFVIDHYAEWLAAEVFVFVGSGNNGGDGFVVARTLRNIGVPVAVVSLRALAELKGDSRKNALSWINGGGETLELTEEKLALFFSSPRLRAAGLFIDCILGTGASGPARGFTADVIEQLNKVSRSGAIPVIAVDIPSGVDASTGKVDGVSVLADVTVTLQSPKVGNILFPGARSTGELYVVDIGVSRSFLEEGESVGQLLEEWFVSEMLSETHNPDPGFHKGTRGHVMILGGSRGTVGAAKLAGYAALKSGAGLVTLGLPQSVSEAAAPVLWELMCSGFPEKEGSFAECSLKDVKKLVSDKDALVIGPGMGDSQGSAEFLESVLKVGGKANIPMVLDADALNIIANHKRLLEHIPAAAVLTPHPGEVSRLLGISVAEVEADRIGAINALREKAGCWVLLKGARTIVSSSQGELFFNPAATEALATAGSGDVLSGIIGAFLARGRSMMAAVLGGVFLHGMAGMVLEKDNHGPYGTIASDIVEKVPELLNVLVEAEPHRPTLVTRVF